MNVRAVALKAVVLVMVMLSHTIASQAEILKSLKAQLTQEEIAWIAENPVVRVHNETDWGPYNFNVDGEPGGFSIDYMRLLAKQTGLEIKFVSGPNWNEFLGMMRAGELDVMLNIVDTPGRRGFLLFTDPYAVTSPVLAVQEQVADVNSLDDLAGLTLCLPQGSSTEEFMRQRYPDVPLLPLNDATACLHAVADGRAYAAIEGYSILNHLMKASRLPGLRVANIAVDPDMASVMSIATNIEQPVLRNILQKAMGNLPASEVAELRQRWLGSAPVAKPVATGIVLTKAERQWIKDNPVISAHNTSDWPPFNFRSKGSPSGYSVDYLNLVAGKVGLQVDYVNGPTWAEFLDMTRSGDLDVMLNISPTAERSTYIHFTESYAVTPSAIVVRSDAVAVQSLQDLHGKRVSVADGNFQAEVLAREHPEIELLLQDDSISSLYAVLEGRADAMTGDYPVLDYMIKENALTGLRIAFIDRNPNSISVNAIGVRYGVPILRDILQKGMDSITESAVADLRQRWLGSGLTPTSDVAKLELTEEEYQWIAENPVIRVHTEADWAPFNYVENGQAKGFSIDYMNLLAARSGLQIEYVIGPTWTEVIEMVQSDQLDVVMDTTPTPEREAYLNFTEAYAQSPWAVMVRDTTLKVQSFEDLHGKRVAVAEGYATAELLAREHPEIELVLEPDTLGLIYAVYEGRADALLDNIAVTNYLIDEHTLTGFRVAFMTRSSGMSSSHSMGVREDWPDLKNILQKTMDSLAKEDVTALRQKWLGATIAQSTATQMVALTPEETAWLAEHPVIRMGVDPIGTTYDFVDEQGQHQGFTADMLALILPRVGVNVQLVPGLTWPGVIEGVRNRSVDMASLCSRTPEREAFMVFTEPLTRFYLVAVTRQTDTPVISLDDVGARRLSIGSGQAVIETIRSSNPGIAITEVDSTLAGLEAVSTGETDVFIGSLSLIVNRIRSDSLLNLRIGRVAELTPSPQYTCIRSDWPELAGILNKGLASITDAERSVIEQKWIPVTLSTGADEGRSQTETIIWLIGITLGIFLVLFLLNRLIRRFTKDDGVGLQAGTPRFRIMMLVSLSIFVVLVAVLGWFALEQIRGKILNDMRNNLENVLVTTAERLDMWVDQRQTLLAQIARTPELVAQTEQLLKVEANAESLLASTETKGLRTILDQFREELELGFFVINRDGISIGSARDGNIGTRNLIAENRPGLLARVFAGEAVFVPPIHSDVALGEAVVAKSISLFIAVPVLSNSGEVIAALTMRLDPSLGFSRVMQFSRVGESGESYAFDQTGILLSASRFDSDLRAIELLGEDDSSILNIQIRDPGGNMTEGFRSSVPRSEQAFTLMAESVISAGKDNGNRRSPVQSNLEGYRDYRGVPVFGAWLWGGELGVGLTSEIDVEEALSTLNVVQVTAIGVLAVTLFLSLGGVLFILVTGERTNRVLTKARDELEDRVEERTKDLTKATKQTEQILENATDGILTIDDEQIVVGFNPACEELWGYSAEEVLGQPITILIPEYARKDHLKNVHKFRDAESEGIHMENRGLKLFGLTKGGVVFPAEVGIAKNEIEGEIFYSAFVKDITERQKAEAEILEARKVAELASQAKGDFLANMSHEIRTPMNAIMGLSDLCLRTELNPKQNDYLEKIHASAQSLLGIINDILDFSKIEAGKLDMESIPFEIDQILDNLATVVTVKTQEKGLELLFARDPNVPPVLVGDAMRLGQVMVNLVNNAVKFTDTGEIVVQIDVIDLRDEDLTLQFSVRDTGIGMNEEQQSRLFKSFSQADTSTTRKYGGTGLGLAISKQLVELMDGKIWVESEAGKGSNFIFTAKLGIGEVTDERELIPNTDLRGMRAMVVDDNETSREILSTYLEAFTFKVSTAEDGYKAIDLLQSRQPLPDLIVMDWLMPGMNGLETAQKIKQELNLEKDPHIIMVSAFASSSLANQAGAEFVDNLLTKPVSPSHLFDAVMEAFGQQVVGGGMKRGSGREPDMEALRPIQGASLLVVEDNEINQQVAQELLQQALFYVDIANHGQEAIEMIAKGDYDCILMDVQMPVMDGFTATRELRKDDRYKSLPILAMTANATHEDRKRCEEAGMDDHIAKPILPKILFDTLLKWVPHKERELPDAPDDEFVGDVPAELPDLPGVDTEGGLTRVGGNINTYLKLLNKFAENQADAINGIRSAVADGDGELSVRLAHTLKGVGGAIGATALQDVAGELEAILKDEPKDLPVELLALAELELNRLLDLLKALDSDDTESDAGTGGDLPADLPERLSALMEKLDDYDAEAEDILDEILEQVKGSEIYDPLRSLRKQIGQYDFDAAAEALKPIMDKYSE